MAMSFGSFASRVVATRVVALDGTGDFTDIQSAIDDLPSGGGVVYVKEGSYTEDVTVSGNNISIIGSGYSSSLTCSTASNPALTISGNYCYVDKMLLKGQAADTPSIVSFTGSDGTITNCWVNNGTAGIVCTGSRVLIYGNHISGLIGFGTQYAVQLTTGNQCIVLGNDCTTGNAINSSQQKTIIYGNNCRSTTTGIVVSGNYSKISNNIIQTNKISGITVSSSYCTVDSNIVNDVNGTTSGEASFGMKITGSENVVSGNVVYDVATTVGTNGYGIWVTGDRNILASNRIDTTADDGVLVDTTADRTLVHGNIILNFTNEAIDNNGTNTTTADNIIA